MPRDISLACKKRQHPDGLHLSSSLPKRLFSISEAEMGSSVEDASTAPGTDMNTPPGSLCNSATSALINSNCTTSIRPIHSSVFLGAASSKREGPGFMSSVTTSDVASSELEGPGFVLARLPSDSASSKLEGSDWMDSLTQSNVASCNLGALNCTRDSLAQGKAKAIWTYCSDSVKHEGLDCEGDVSEVTFEKHARTLSSGHEPDGESGPEKATHVISRRDVSSLNSKDELWYKAAHGYGECVSRGKRWGSSSKLYDARQRRDYSFSSMASESASSCATGNSSRQKQAFPYIHQSVCKELSRMSSNTDTRAEVLGGPRLQERIGFKDDNTMQRHPVFTHKAETEETSTSYVLSSGRMSLEEEAKLGRRAPTIDHDFEEYFSSLML